MIELITGSQMAAIDRRAMVSGVPSLELMEAAGQGVTRVAENLLGELQNRHIVVLCGKGNNGGDGFVMARQAAQCGANVQVFTATSANEITGDAKTNLDRLPANIIHSVDRIATVQNALSHADLAVDALLGTGMRGAARGIYADLIHALTRAECPVVAVDIPSGLNADTGQIEGPCASATCTVTFARPRIGHFFYPGRAQCGKLHLIDIGIPPSAIARERIYTYLIDNRRCVLPHRAPNAHKGDCGRVYILAGSVGLTGAAALSANAALKGGAGLVTLGIPKSLNDILETKVTEAMTHPLPEVKKVRCLSLRGRGDIQRACRKADSIAIGPGLGTHRETVELIRRLVRDLGCPAVIDADALNALAGDLDALRACDTPIVLTPHIGEFARLTGCRIAQIQRDPIALALEFATRVGATIVLKGAPTIVATPEGQAHINPTGNPGMATGGTGDVLTGLLAALIGQGIHPSDAACTAVYLHGLAADIAIKKTGTMSLIASDIIENFAPAIHQIHSSPNCLDLHT